mmetsp:Transcript_61908/g.85358  ORF Transcript_61908/g.85358 Transcript_61908/m.85358 type:complete len:242 (-) Transcript_61908:154-879(-)
MDGSSIFNLSLTFNVIFFWVVLFLIIVIGIVILLKVDLDLFNNHVSIVSETNSNEFLEWLCNGRGVLNLETRVQKCHMEHQTSVFLFAFRNLTVVLLNTFKKVSHDWMVRVQFQGLLGKHIAGSLLLVSESLGLVNLFHLSGVTILRSENKERSINQLVGDSDFLDLLTKRFLVPVNKRLVHFLKFLELLLCNLIITINDGNIILGNRFDLSLFVFSKMLGAELVDGITKEEHFVTLACVL